MSPSTPLARRRLLGGMAAGALLGGCAQPRTPFAASSPAAAPPVPGAAPASPERSSPGEMATTLLWLNRLSWGANDSDLAQAQSMGRQAWLRAQLSPRLPVRLPPAVQARVDALDISRHTMAERWQAIDTLRRAADRAASDAERLAARQAWQQELQQMLAQTTQRHLLRAVHSPQPLHELMSWFWFNHFNVFQRKHQVRLWLADYEDQALRPHALGSFRALLGAATRHPAMLQYLDNAQNGARRLNENHARELLELHTLGVDGGYSQKDVQELARVLTGHGLAQGAYVFTPARHDFGGKQLLGRALRSRGADELDEVLDALVAHPATARFISRKLALFLLGDAPGDALLQAMATAFTQGQGQIAPVLQVLVQSAEFNAGTPRFKTPLRHVLGALRLAQTDRHEPMDTDTVARWLNQLGQGLYQRVTPDGYPPQAEAWNSSGQLAQRFDVARAIGAGRAARDGGAPALQARQVVQQMLVSQRPATRDALAAAGSRADWNALLLASPEFMHA